ncbi:MAG: serine hydrolase domain-containing protein, partial [Allosphingosinicella sp.]|uniref:serine hydrolase domain-containing protein n=1 Tax=Allosphingosinicella sp. TaxID=2823234 RepID=UPI0039316FF0
MRRFAWIFVPVLLFAGIVWAATGIRFVEPDEGPSAVEQEIERATADPGSFQATIGEAAHARPRGAIDYARIDARLRLLIERNNMVGLAVGIVEDGEIRFLKGYGETIAGSRDPVTPNTVFRWASLSKGVAGDMVALLAEENKLSLHEPVSRYSSTLRLPEGKEQVATLADVLAHTLGIFAHANDSKLEDGLDPRMLRASLNELSLICPVGQCHAYQNVAFDAAAEAVERATGKTYADAVRERLFLPLGMTGASMSMEGLMTAPSWARPHVGGRNSKPVEVTEPYYRVPAAGGVNGSIKDLAIWLRAQMGAEPEVLNERVLALAHAPRTATPGERARRRKYQERIADARYGLGWRVFDYAGNEVVAHRGGVRGYRSLIMFDPRRRSGVVALWNSSASQPGGLEYEVMDMLYGLPFRDWLELEKFAPRSAEEPTEVVDEGGT